MPGGRPFGTRAMTNPTDRFAIAVECRKHLQKVINFWLEALEATATYEEGGIKRYKYNTQDQFQAAKSLVEYAYGKPVQPIAGLIEEHSKQILEVRWLPPRPDDKSKAVDLKPGE